MTLVLVRHGETAWNAQRRMQGATDNPLSPVGRDQARAVAVALEGCAARVVVSSPLTRARQTAGVIASHLGIADVTVDDDLRERELGSAEGMLVAESRRRWPGDAIPDAEPVEVVAARGARALARLAGVDAIVVAHGLLLRTTLEGIVGASVERILTAEHVVLHDDGRVERPALDRLRGRDAGHAASSTPPRD